MQSDEPVYPLWIWGIISVIVSGIQIVLWFLQENPAISESFLEVYLGMGWKVLVISWLMFLYQVVERMGFSLSLMEFEEDNNPIENFWAKLFVIVFFAGMMLLPLTTMHAQVLPIPHTINEGFSVDPVTTAGLSSVVPGFLEDIWYLFFLPYVFFLIMGVLALLIFKMDFRESRGTYWLLRIMGILIAVMFFVSDHSEVYERDLQAYLSAFVFGFLQSLIYAFTGIVLPLAHILHNAVISLGFVTALAIGGVPIVEMMLPLLAPLRIKLGSVMGEARLPCLFTLSREVANGRD